MFDTERWSGHDSELQTVSERVNGQFLCVFQLMLKCFSLFSFSVINSGRWVSITQEEFYRFYHSVDFVRTTNWMLNSQVSGVAIQLRLRYYRSLKPCELQKPIPNHQSSFCWICLPLLTLSILRSSCPPSHHWISLGFHFAGLSPISLVGLSGWPGEGWYPKHINWSLGFPRDRFLDPSSSPHTLHRWLPSYRHMASPTISMLAPIIQAHGFSYHFYADDTQLYLSFRPDDPTVAARISGCLADISAWMKEHYLQLNLAKTELLVFPATPTLLHDFTI